MGKLTDAVKAGLEGFASAFGPAEFQAAGRKIVCSHCQGSRFRSHQALLNTRGATLVNLDWLDPSGVVLVCEKCHRIEWFAKSPERLG